MMCADVIDAKIPLLISLSAMKKARTVIDTANDTAVICGKKIKMNRIGGHYTISLRKGVSQAEDEDSEEVPALGEEDVEDVDNEGLIVRVLDDPASWKKELTKLHSQM